MSEKTEHLNAEWNKYEDYIRSGGQDACLRESFLINHSTALRKRIQELEAEQQWRVFDKNDETSWPHPPEMHPDFHGKARGKYWVARRSSDNGEWEVMQEYWYTRPRKAVDEMWAHSVLFWQPIPVPSPPTSETEK